MKLRDRYVSNSSTTSFCIVGVEVKSSSFDQEKLKATLMEYEFTETEIKENQLWDLFKKFSNMMDDMSSNTSPYKDLWAEYGSDNCDKVVGMSIRSMRDDETLGQFKDRVYELLKAFGYLDSKEKIRIFVDSRWDG